MSLRERGYLTEDSLEEAITVMGVEDTIERLTSKIKTLIRKVEDVPAKKAKLQSILRRHAAQLLVLADKIQTKRTTWQKVRGY